MTVFVDLALDWQTPIMQAPDVVKLVHLAARMDGWDMEEYRVKLLKLRRSTYESELTMQAAKVGCPGRVGRLGNNAILNSLNADSLEDAKSIVNTYNHDLYSKIMSIRAEHPKANRNHYAAYLREWSAEREKWKNTQVTQYTTNSARSKAQTDFYANNSGFGTATMQPRQSVCPVCGGWIARGEVPLRVATNNPPPYHVNCPHTWLTRPDKVAKEECPLLWMGE